MTVRRRHRIQLGVIEAVAAAWVALVLLSIAATQPAQGCGRTLGGSCAGASPAIAAAIATPDLPSGAMPTPAGPTDQVIQPSPVASPVTYTFRDEFGGTSLRPAWGRHWPGFGAADWAGAQSSVADGVLTITARRSGTGWVSDLVDTAGSFVQRYGVFSARIRFTEGTGLWPAFWLAQPPNSAHQLGEVDVMEVCANPVGTRDGNDATLLHTFVHNADGTHAFADRVRVAGLPDAWHVYTVEWRPGSMRFLIDGVEFTHFTGTAVSTVPMAVVLDLAGGGGFCGPADASTPKVATMQIDWVRVSR